MKRKNYDIYLDGKLIHTKHAFNTAGRFPASYINELPAGYYKLIESTIEKDDNMKAVYGIRKWLNNDTGVEYLFEIKLRVES